jgi:protein SCO1/2
MKRFLPPALGAVTALGLIGYWAHVALTGHEAHAGLAALDQTVLQVAPADPLALPTLVASDGRPFAAGGLRGRWSVVFFGFTACPHVCPTTLQTLAAVARDPASGVASGRTQVVFVSVDPRDTPEVIRAYVGNFDARIVGLGGREDAVARFAAAAGAGFAAAGGGIDHSTSLFVVDPEGRLAAVILRPSQARRVVSDLRSLRGFDG